MSALVPADEIEGIVGARRHQAAHLGRAVSADQTVYVLHSRDCKDSGVDLRQCLYSRALDRGIVDQTWEAWQDQVVTLQVHPGLELAPDPNGPDDVELLDGITLRDIDNRGDDMEPYEFTGTPGQVCAYINGPLRSDLTGPAIQSLPDAMDAVRSGDLETANHLLNPMGVDLRSTGGVSP